MKVSNYKNWLLGSAIVLGLSACSVDFNDDSDDDEPQMQMKMFEVTLTNLTQGQPFSPPALFLHSPDTHLWVNGEVASVALEKLAEGGDAMDLTSMTEIDFYALKDMPLAPADSVSWTFEILNDSTDALSIATMLVNTNDAFTGVDAMALDKMMLGEMHTSMLMAYDAGTEMNDEMNLPGPAASAEGFNPSRDGDVNRVYVHSGILTQYELSGSVLMAGHKFDNPVAKITLKRVQ